MYKLQIANQEDNQWENINHSDLDQLTQGEAQRIARQKNEYGPYTYRAVDVDCPQEPIQKTQQQEEEVEN